MIKPPSMDRDKDQKEFSQAFLLTALPMTLITELILNKGIPRLEDSVSHFINFKFTVYSAAMISSRFVHMERFQHYLDDRCTLLA